ncbi:pseudouridine synthase [Salinirubellus salinus]|uniref:Pseudouridine synthase n=1 Tax=Salinirubellus salinus TaxID=1364945 RepID=A0A9E7R5E3_9EURY|nr:PUA domain-containing protein [Salinirubellus salinus]UWM55058.1 pseudouridine synthase [Salinirubellus salinus]
MSTDDVDRLRTVADYQFGVGAGRALFAPPVTVRHTSSGRPEQVLVDDDGVDGERLVSYGVDGRFTLGAEGGRRLHAALPRAPPAYRVFVGDDSEPFVREGRNAFAKFVVEADPAIRPGDEVLVVHERAREREGTDDGDLLAVGRAELPASAMLEFETGMAVKVREGIDRSD